MSDERDEDNKEFDEKYKELGVNKFLGLFENLKDELEYESMRKYEIQNRLQREGKHDKLFRKFMNSYLTTIVLDNKMEMKK